MGTGNPDPRLLRDLQWAISSPQLMRDGDRALVGSDLIASGAALGDFTDRYEGHRVGYYFENLIYYWLKHERGVEMLAHGHQIQKEGRTIGELDFVFRDGSDRVCHWEVAAKFYLYSADQQVLNSQFIGPNARDTFERKRDKLFTHQLPLSESVFPEVTERTAFVKGRIFYHPQQARPREFPDGLAPGHLEGIWLREADLDWLEAEGRTRDWAFLMLDKPFWLAPHVLDEGGAKPESIEELKVLLGLHFLMSDHPILVSAMRQEGDRKWVEAERLFVVADEWPQV